MAAAFIPVATPSAASQSCLLFLHPTSPLTPRRPSSSTRRSTSTSVYLKLSPVGPSIHISDRAGRFLTAVVDPESVLPSLSTDPIPAEEVGSGGGEGSAAGGGGGGDGNSGSFGGGGREEGGERGDREDKMSGMSMSQKLTLGYAALVGVGGVMGYIKSGSQKSLAAGGMSALALYYVYTQLPVRLAFASSLGLGISAALLGVMGSRFNKSKKIFPAGVVSIVSLVMVGGYLHGIMRSLHA